MRTLFVGLAVAALGLSAGSARADLPAPGPETCSLEKQQKPGEDCVSCSASFEDTEACKTKHSASGYSQRCRSSGASVWTEVWCRESPEPVASAAASSSSGVPTSSGSTRTEPAAPPEKSGSCGACSVLGAPEADAPAWLLFLLFAASSRRIRRPS
ncbi:MAG: hypothetical protein IPI67_28090 [Myxococcales bacterium]|nr:hypothetical protein [Myxococcales bacterium]